MIADVLFIKKMILHNINEKDNYVALAKCLSFYPVILLGNSITVLLTNLCDEYSELVEVGETIRIGAKLTDHLVEPLSPSHRVLHREKRIF